MSAVVLALACHLVAQPIVEREAEGLAEHALQSLDASDYQGAATLFIQAYQKHALPEYLLQAAQAYENARLAATALNLYLRYLQEVPEGRYHGSIKRRLPTLAKLAKKTHGEVIVEADPPGASVYIGGLPAGKAPMRTWLEKGRVEITVDWGKEGGREQVIVVVEPGGVATVKAESKTLRPDTRRGDLKIEGLTTEVEVTVSGQRVPATATARTLKLRPGNYKVVAKTLKGRVLLTRWVKIAAGETATVDLKKAPGRVAKKTDKPGADGAASVHSAMWPTGWALFGVSLAAAGGGVAMHVLSQPDDGLRTGAYATYGAAGGLLLTSIILLAVDASQDAPAVSVTPTRGGAFTSVSLTF